MTPATPRRRTPRCRICGHDRDRHNPINTAGGRLLDLEPCDCGNCPDYAPMMTERVGDPRGLLS